MKRSELRDFILEAYVEVLAESDQLPTTKEILLGKFPTLKKNVENLFTKQYDSFIDSIDWVAPRPSTFRIKLKNNQALYLKWTGTTFEAQIQGKKYMLSKVDDFQQALDRLADLLKQEKPKEDSAEVVDDFQEPGIDAPSDIESTDDTSDDFEFEEPGEEPEA
jgi:hypothetical protein